MAKIGDKYIIEIEEVIREGLYKVKGADYFVVGDDLLNRLEKLTEDDEDVKKDKTTGELIGIFKQMQHILTKGQNDEMPCMRT